MVLLLGTGISNLSLPFGSTEAEDHHSSSTEFRTTSGAGPCRSGIVDAHDPEGYGLPVSTSAPRRRGDRSRRLLADLEGLVEARRKKPRDDILSSMIFAEEQGQRLTCEELIATLIFLFSAGHSTTRDLLGSGLVAMLSDRDQYATLVTDPTLAAAAVEESLRFESPIKMLRRRAIADTAIGNTKIAAGESVVAVLLAANRDPDRFDEPDRFIIDRPDNRPVSFGGDIHHCVGAALARMEAEVVFRALATRFPHLALTDPRIAWRDTPVFRGLLAVNVSPSFGG